MCSQSAISEFHQAMPGSSASYANAEAACSGGGMQIHSRSGIELAFCLPHGVSSVGSCSPTSFVSCTFEALNAMRLLGTSSNCLNVQYFALASQGSSFLEGKGILAMSPRPTVARVFL